MSQTSAQLRRDERSVNGPQRLTGQSRLAGAQTAHAISAPVSFATGKGQNLGRARRRCESDPRAREDADDDHIIVRTI